MKKKWMLWAAAALLAGTLGCGSRADTLPQETTETEQEIQIPETEQILDGEEATAGGSGREAAESSADAGSGEGQETAGLPEEDDLQMPEEAEILSADRPKVRGIYVTGPMAGTAGMDKLIELVERTELNALVIDIKNDEGYVTCELDAPLTAEIGSVKRYVRDMPALVEKCKEKGIYLIARVVAFRDPVLAEAKPEWSLHNADGSIFRDKSGLAWVNPYEEQTWEYLAQIAEGAVALGFDEVQFDYIRFSTDSGMKQVDFGEAAQEKSKTEAITEFAAFAAKRLHDVGAAVSADVYGVVIDSAVDQQIVGQDYVALAEQLDYLSPMVYPSHYGAYNYNIPIPDAQPYETVLAAMQASKKVLSGVMKVEVETEASVSGNDVSGNNVSGNDVSGNDAADTEGGIMLSAEEIAALCPMETVRAKVRPWLQDFTATWVKGHISYGPEQIRAQIRAVYDAGYEEWILWNAANRYTEGGLYGTDGQPAEEQPAEDGLAGEQPAEEQPTGDGLTGEQPAGDGLTENPQAEDGKALPEEEQGGA